MATDKGLEEIPECKQSYKPENAPASLFIKGHPLIVYSYSSDRVKL